LESSETGFSLYIHVPFCRSKCIYCDFFSVAHHGGAVPREREQNVCRQTILQARRLADAAGMVRACTTYVGGGTPSLLAPEALSQLLDFLGPLSGGEWTVEANPESVDAGFLGACAAAGVTRLSVGIQTGRERLLQLLGRPGGRDDNARALSLLSSAWRGELSLDFLAGIPGQEADELLEDIMAAPSVRAGHASLYSLTVEEGTGLERLISSGALVPNPPAWDEELWLTARAALEAAGYQGYEISNFAKPGHECRHNLRYWSLEPYIGSGPGAVSTLPAAAAAAALGRRPAARGAAVARITSPRDIDSFLRGEAASWGMECEEVSDRDFLLETLMMGLRVRAGIPAEGLWARFGRSFDELFPGLRDGWTAAGIMADDPRGIRLTEAGRLMLDRHLRVLAGLIRRADLPTLSVCWP
jgi:oxygen-independent coproporphyrinogen III oxidase